MPRLNDDSPSQSWVAVTPSDTVNISAVPRALYVGVTGDVAAVGLDDQVATFKAVPAGTILPITAKRVNATSTTATNILALL